MASCGAVLCAVVSWEHQRASGHAGIAASRNTRSPHCNATSISLGAGVHFRAAGTFSADARCMVLSLGRFRLT